MSRSHTVLVVEDHPVLAANLKDIFEQQGHRVIGPFGMLAAARLAILEHQVNLAVIDLGLPDGDGMDLIKELHGQGVACAVYSGYERHDVMEGEAIPVHWIDKMDASSGVRLLLEDMDKASS